MPDTAFNVTFEEISAYNWEEVIHLASNRECSYFLTPLFNKAAEYEKAGDATGQKVFRFLGSLASLHPNYESKEETYGPMYRDQNSRSLTLGDLTENDIETLRKLTPIIKDPEFQARVADIVWLRSHDPQFASLAVNAYLASAKRLENPEDWVGFIEKLSRAVQIAVKLGTGKAHFVAAIHYIESLIDKYASTDTGLFCARAMQILLTHGSGDPQKYATIAENLAIRTENNKNWLFARTYWQLVAAWNHLAKNPSTANEARIRAAETFVGEAEAAIGRSIPSYSAAAHFLSVALESLRRAGASKDRIQEIHRRLVKTADRSTEEMKTVASSEIDISQMVASAQALVKGKSLEDALLLLATAHGPTKRSRLRQQVEDNAKAFPFQHLFSAVAVDERGKVTAQKPSLLTNDPQQLEAGILAEMFHQAQLGWQLTVQAFVNPIRLQILEEHQNMLSDLAGFVIGNPFIPPGRENIFARGIYAGLTGDSLIAAHLLIPQIENSLRYVLEKSGIVTSKVSARLIHEERDLNSLLTFPETTDIFGEDMVFDLQGLLVARFGGNLRNRLAHGLLDEAGFYSSAVLYVWWLVLRILCLPLIQQEKSMQEPAAEPATTAEGITTSGSIPRWASEDARDFEQRIDEQFEREQ